MSAFIVCNETLIQIRNKILLDRMRLRPENVSFDDVADEVNAVVKSWRRMNLYAIQCRYGEKIRKPLCLPVWDDRVNMISDIQLFKHLQCLHYQCSEGDTEKRHRKAWNSLQDYMDTAARVVVMGLPQYDKADWG